MERREFLRAIDAVKKRTQRARKFAGLSPDLADRHAVTNSVKDDRDAVAKAASKCSARGNAGLLDLTADGWSVPDIATEPRNDRRARQRREAQGRPETPALSRTV